jgi:hypothetical protein
MPDWSRQEVEAIVDDYLTMLASELAGAPYNKTNHRQRLQRHLPTRSKGSIEFKHQNISAALLEAGFPYIAGYKPRSNYQALLADILADRLDSEKALLELAVQDADRLMAVPEVDDILSVVRSKPPCPVMKASNAWRPKAYRIHLTTNYLEREARNRSLGSAGEAFVLNYEKARLVDAGQERLASKVEHTARVRGDHEGYDILSFETSGRERLIEVKTTKYGNETPFFVSWNEVAVSKRETEKYQVYRLFQFREVPRMYMLEGSIEVSCLLSPTNYLAFPR